MNGFDTNIYVCEEVREVQRLHSDLLTDEARQLPVVEQLDRQAQRILDAHRSGDQAVVTHIKCWHPALVGSSVERIMAFELTLDDARDTIAREYGFADWSDAKERGTESSDAAFETAVDAILCGDVERLRDLLQRKPELTRQRSNYGHRAALLHYVGSNGVETYRQVVPNNLAEVTRVLLDAGADVNATAEMYGGGATTLGLLLTSGHPAEAGLTDEVVKVLVDAGAETNG